MSLRTHALGVWRLMHKIVRIQTDKTRATHRAYYARKMLEPEFRIGKLIAMAKNRAKKKDLLFDIDLPYMMEMWSKQNAKCIISGVEFVLESGEGRVHRHTPSIDRISPELGYTKGNVRLVTYHINVALSEFGEEALIELAYEVTVCA